MSPPDPGGVGKGALLSGALIWPFFRKNIVLFFSSKGGGGAGNDQFSDSPRRAAFKNSTFIFFLVFGPHVGPMQTSAPVKA